MIHIAGLLCIVFLLMESVFAFIISKNRKNEKLIKKLFIVIFTMAGMICIFFLSMILMILGGEL